MYYHIVTNLEKQFKSLQDAINAYDGKTIFPRVPKHTMTDENNETPRICVCRWLPDCLTGIGLRDRLVRCLAGNNCAPIYDTLGNEAYPVLLLEFSDDIETYKPTRQEVPDVYLTNEEWILTPVKPVKTTVKWLSSDSILFDNPSDTPSDLRAISCKFITQLDDKNHPWLNGRGHILTSDAYAHQFETYDDIPIGQLLGEVLTLDSTLEQINEMMAWKNINAQHELRIKTERLTNTEQQWLEIICSAGGHQPPELHLQLMSNPEDPTMLAKSKNFITLDQLERTGLTYQNQIYRPRIMPIDADSETGHIPIDPETTPQHVPSDVPLEQYTIKNPLNESNE